LDALIGGEAKVVRALDGVDITIREREIVGLVGESGCGKSTFGMTLVRMHEPTSGEILPTGKAITHVSGRPLKRYRAKAQIIFQDPIPR
jgi:ABC-type oligopeptide transport system ATPase subunit